MVANLSSQLAGAGSLSRPPLPRAISSNAQVHLLFEDASIFQDAYHADITTPLSQLIVVTEVVSFLNH